MVDSGKMSSKYLTKDFVLYQKVKQSKGRVEYVVPQRGSFFERLGCGDKVFSKFLFKCLRVDPNLRMSVDQALKHEWLKE